ncbi:MAG: DMT family transporter [Thermoproteota archaeon]|nr:DMT family transporter [Thermoproteota archaeon]
MYGYVAAFISAALVGSIFPIAKPILAGQIQPLTLSSLIYLIAGFFMVPVMLIGKRNKKEKKSLKKDEYAILLVIGLLGGGIAPFLFFEGLKRTTASNASVLEGGELLFTVMIALLFFKEKLTKIGYLGMTITIIGVTLISLSSTTTNNIPNSWYNFNLNLNFGNILIILSTLCWGLDNNISKIISRRITSTAKIVLIKSLIGGTLLLIISFFLGYKLNFDITQIPYLLFLGIGGFGLSLFFFIESLRIIGTLKTIIIFSSSTIFGLILSFIILNEKIGIMQLIATTLVILGLYYVNKDELNYLKQIKQKKC